MQTQKEIRARYYEKNKERIKAKSAAFYKNNKELVLLRNREYCKKYYAENKEAFKEKDKENRIANNARKAEWALKNKSKIQKAQRKWQQENKEKKAVYVAKRRALKASAEAIMTKEEVENYENLVKIRDEATVLFGYEWHIDHIIPLSKGGTNAIDNLEVVPASWNISKGNRHSQSFWD